MPVIGTELERNRVTNPRARTADLAPIPLRTNLCTNPSVETDLTGYSAVAGTGGVAALTRATTPILSRNVGTWFAQVNWTTGTTAPSGGIQYAGASGTGVPVVAGLPYAFSWYVMPGRNARLQLSVEWRNASNAVVSTSTAAASLIVYFQYTRLQLVATAPAGAVRAIVRVLAVAGTGALNWATNDALVADGLLIEQTTRILSYFDPGWRSFGTVTANGDGTSTLYDTVATTRTNLSMSPSGEIDPDLTYVWTSGIGNGGVNRARSSAHALYGTQSVQISRLAGSTGASAALWQLAGDAFQPGDQYTFSCYVWSAVNRPLYSWGETIYLDRSGDGMASFGSGTPGSSTPKPITGGQWTRISQTFTVPAGGLPASQLMLGFGLDDLLPDPVWVDGVLIELGAELRPYFDGNSPSNGLETHAWSLVPATGAQQPDVGVSRRVAPHPLGLSGVLGAEYWQYATGGVGVSGTLLRSSAAGSGVAWASATVGAGSYTAIVQVRAVDAVSITALGDQTYALAAGEVHEFRRAVVTTGTGVYSAQVLQNDAAPKRWVITQYALVPGASYAGPYFDGSMAAPDTDTRYTWVGAPDASETVHELLPAPHLTATVDPVSKGVQLLAEGIALVQRVTIQRVAAGYPIAQPIGARNAATTGGTLLTFDNTAPLGVPVTYQVQGSFSDGSTSGWSAPITVTIPVEPNEVWLKDIGQPMRSTRVVLRELGGKSRKAQSEIHNIQDSEYPVAVSGRRQAASEDVTFGTTTEAARTKMEALLATGQVLLLQCPPGWGRPDAYITLGDYRELRLVQIGTRPERNWQVTIQEVAEPTTDRTGLPNSSYRQVMDDFASYRAVMSNRSSYLGVLANSSDVQ